MKVTFTTLNITGSVVEGENPLPVLCDRERDHKLPLVNGDSWPIGKGEFYGEDNGHKVLPYKLRDRYSRDMKQRQYRLVVLENDRLKAEILPDFGGKLYALKDKTTDRDLIFRDPVLRIVNISMTDAWTVGGIEWNFGYHNHTPFAVDTVYTAKLKDNDGNEFVRIYEYERMRGFFYQLDFHLPKGSDALFTHGRVVNDTGRDIFFDWWSDIGIAEVQKMRVLSGADDVVYFQPFKGERASTDPPYSFGCCSLSEMCSRLEFDVTYPENFKYAAEYFLQGPAELKAPWLAAVYPDGFAFFNRSTERMKNKKMYTWGKHPAGLNWRDYLVAPGQGDHIEVQSGMGTTQTHMLLLKSGETWEWTDAFSSANVPDMKAAYDPDIAAANAYLYKVVDAKMPEAEIYRQDEIFSALVSKTPDEIMVCGSGYGTIERKRREKEGRTIPNGLVFPDCAIGAEELPWLNLLQNGIYTELSVNDLPASYMTGDDYWVELLKQSLQREQGENHSALTQLGVMLYEKYEFENAIDTWKKSLELKPTAIAYRNLAVAYDALNNVELAQAYMRSALEAGGAELNDAFCEEYMKMLVHHGCYSQAWDYFISLRDDQKTDEIILYAGLTCVETGNEDFAPTLFNKQLRNMREYDNDSFTAQIWYKYMAIMESKKLGIPCNKDLLAKVKAEMIVPAHIDFRIVP